MINKCFSDKHLLNNAQVNILFITHYKLLHMTNFSNISFLVISHFSIILSPSFSKRNQFISQLISYFCQIQPNGHVFDRQGLTHWTANTSIIMQIITKSFVNKVASSYSYKFAPKKIKAKSPAPNSKTLRQLFHSKGNWTTLGIKSRLKYTTRKLKTTSIILLVLIKNHFKANKLSMHSLLHTPFSNFDSIEKPKFSNTHTSVILNQVRARVGSVGFWSKPNHLVFENLNRSVFSF